MRSFKKLYQRLPDEFIETISAQFEPRTLEKILAGFMVKRPVTLRVNSIKTNVREVMEVFRRNNIKFERVLWYEDALIIRSHREKDLETHQLYQDGQIYLQSLSSMLPPLVLNPKPGQAVLDLTAAPGGKSTQLAALMKNTGFLLANELNHIRAERLKFNVERQGASIIEVQVQDGKRLDPKWNEFFDSVLLDAPCSGTGLFSLENPQTYRGWSCKRLRDFSREQKKLFEAAFRALKPGGLLVYSTCSLMREENEDIIDWALEHYQEHLIMEPIQLNLIGASLANPNTKRPKLLTVIPSELYEGFFLAKLRKTTCN